jgi:hypothetical protein
MHARIDTHTHIHTHVRIDTNTHTHTYAQLAADTHKGAHGKATHAHHHTQEYTHVHIDTRAHMNGREWTTEQCDTHNTQFTKHNICTHIYARACSVDVVISSLAINGAAISCTIYVIYYLVFICRVVYIRVWTMSLCNIHAAYCHPTDPAQTKVTPPWIYDVSITE